MRRLSPRALVAVVFGILIIGAPSKSFAAGGSCPTGSNYLSLTSPQTGGGMGSVTLASLGVTSCFYIRLRDLTQTLVLDESHSWLHAPGCLPAAAHALPPLPHREMDSSFAAATHGTVTPAVLSLAENGHGARAAGSGSPIYIGVDITWFSGSSFSRPIFNEDNPITTRRAFRLHIPGRRRDSAQLF